MRFAGVILFTLLIPVLTWSQQVPINALEVTQPILVNPAVVGSDLDYHVIDLNYRKQWVGLEGAPETQFIAFHSNLSKYNIGLGGQIFNDVTGALRNTGVKINYAYHVPIDEDKKISFGLAGGIFQSRLDYNKLDFDLAGDPVQFESGISAMSFDVDLGAYFYNKIMYIGFSIPQALQTKTRFVVDSLEAGNQHVRHYNLTAGYKMKISPNFEMLPSTLITGVEKQKFLVDVGCRMIYKEKYALGAHYRTNGDYIVLGEFRISKLIRFAYAYEGGTSVLSSLNNGTHEAGLTFKLEKKYNRSPIETSEQ